MNLTQLKAMPTQDLIDLYNDLTEKQVKRMATRADAERRTREALVAAGKWQEEGAAQPTEQAGKPAPKAKQGKGKGKPAAAAPAKAPAKEAASASNGRGAPKKNLTYLALKVPKDTRMNASSSRTIVYNELAKHEEGKTREWLENKFKDTDYNVKSALDYLVKFKMAKIKA